LVTQAGLSNGRLVGAAAEFKFNSGARPQLGCNLNESEEQRYVDMKKKMKVAI
jgi:hypothetical protein